jgi:hypothetical protein
MRRCFEPAAEEGLNPLGPFLMGGGGGGLSFRFPLPVSFPFVAVVPYWDVSLEEESGLGKSVSASDLMTSSGASRTAESTNTSVMRCNEGETSAGFHCSSSTSFADCVIRAWWNACRNTFA